MPHLFYLVVNIHLVEFIDAADAVVGQHERSGLDDKLGALLVLDDGGSQASGGARLAGGVDRSRTEVGNLSIVQKIIFLHLKARQTNRSFY